MTLPADFASGTRAYYAWLQRYLVLDAGGLAQRLKKMDKKAAFPFLRGTFYRWPAHLLAVPEPVRQAPVVLSVGDVHLENFGTWRDAEGRLVWGINDLDEAVELPFTSDLVRLATSLAIELADESLGAKRSLYVGLQDGIAALLEGYRDALDDGRPYILDEERHRAIREIALRSYDPAGEWKDIVEDGDEAVPADADVRDLLVTSLPAGAREITFRKVHKGLGSLGRSRWRVIAAWNGGRVAREAKATAPSAALAPRLLTSRITDQRRLSLEARRAPDPMSVLTERWSVCRLSPEARKLELAGFVPVGGSVDPSAIAAGQRALLRAMGGELGNVHVGTARDQDAMRAWLAAAGLDWLTTAAELSTAAVRADYEGFRRDPG